MAKRQKKVGRPQSPEAQRLLRTLYSGHVHPTQFFASLKSAFPRAISAAVTSQFRHPSTTFHPYAFGVTMPRHYGDLLKARYLYAGGDISRELRWHTIALDQHTPIINAFAEYRDQFEAHLILGEYDLALAALGKCEADCGHSVWTLERRFLALELQGGFEQNAIALSDLNKDTSVASFLKLLAQYASMRVEQRLSIDNYLVHITRILQNIAASPVKDYLRYRLDPLGCDADSILASIGTQEGDASIVDRYTFALFACQQLVLDEPELVAATLDTLPSISDPLLARLRVLASPHEEVRTCPISEDVLNVLDLYTSGDYSSCIEAAELAIRHYPTVFELYDVYVRSAAFMPDDVEIPFASDSIAFRIIDSVNMAYLNRSTAEDHLSDLLKTAYSLGISSLSRSLYAFWLERTGAKRARRERLSALVAGRFDNPRTANVFKTPDRAIDFLTSLGKRYPQSLTIKFWSALTAASDSRVRHSLPTEIPETRRLIYSARVLCRLGQHAEALVVINELQEALDRETSPARCIIQDEATHLLCEVLLGLNDFRSCLSLVIEQCVAQPSLLRTLPLDDLLRLAAPACADDINYPIACALSSALPDRDVYVAYDNFMTAHHLVRPMEVASLRQTFEHNSIALFLEKVCTLKILRRSWHFSGTEDLESERIKICQYLSGTADNPRRHFDEIAEITQRSLIRRGIQRIDESKIYADEKGIRSSAEHYLRESHLRLQRLSTVTATDLRFIDTSNVRLFVARPTGELAEVERPQELDLTSVEIILDAHYALFKELFLEIRDRFISSNEYGLDAYLSVRIRHGTLQNQLRSPFEKYHLISQKTAGEYVLNPYWDSRLSWLNDSVRMSLQARLAEFSKRVDTAIVALNENNIQVRSTNRHPEGFFDYDYTDAELLEILRRDFAGQLAYEDFLDGVFGILWHRTEENLARIRTHITDKLLPDLYGQLADLQSYLLGIADLRYNEIVTNVASCQTDIQTEVNRVARWFNLAGSASAPDFNLDEAVRICIESVNNLFPGSKISPITAVKATRRLHGRCFTHFCDILRALLTNIVAHSGLNGTELQIQINATLNDQSLILDVCNNLSEEARLKDPAQVLLAKKDTLRSGQMRGIVRTEGGTGYAKILKTLEYDLGRQSFDLNFGYDEAGHLKVRIEMEMEGLLA